MVREWKSFINKKFIEMVKKNAEKYDRIKYFFVPSRFLYMKQFRSWKKRKIYVSWDIENVLCLRHRHIDNVGQYSLRGIRTHRGAFSVAHIHTQSDAYSCFSFFVRLSAHPHTDNSFIEQRGRGGACGWLPERADTMWVHERTVLYFEFHVLDCQSFSRPNSSHSTIQSTKQNIFSPVLV